MPDPGKKVFPKWAFMIGQISVIKDDPEVMKAVQHGVSEWHALTRENELLRMLLWIRHGSIGEHLMCGDDGEMQCSKCRIDFKRDSADSIKARFEQMGIEMIRQHCEKYHPEAETNG